MLKTPNLMPFKIVNDASNINGLNVVGAKVLPHHVILKISKIFSSVSKYNSLLRSGSPIPVITFTTSCT